VRRVLAALAALLPLAALAARDFVDDAGRRVALPDKVERVYAAGPPASALVFAIAPDKLLGWTRAFRPNEKEWVPKKYGELPELGRLTGRGNTANVEVVLKAKPDLIVDVGSTAATFASLADRVQQQTGIPYVLLDGRLATTPEQIEKLAAILGDEAKGRELAAYWRSKVDALTARIATVPADKRPSVYYARGPQGLVTGLGGSINVEIVTNDPNFMRDVWRMPVWQSVSAVRKKRVYLSPHVPFGWFDYPPGPNRLLGLLWLSEILYPGLFRHDYPREIAEFHRRFYHQEPTAAQVEKLLAEPGVAPR
jgi:iron complex transport system substrate-binding protein